MKHEEVSCRVLPTRHPTAESNQIRPDVHTQSWRHPNTKRSRTKFFFDKEFDVRIIIFTIFKDLVATFTTLSMPLNIKAIKSYNQILKVPSFSSGRTKVMHKNKVLT